MNFYLLQLVGKWISFISLSLLSLFNYNFETENMTLINDNYTKNVNAFVEVTEYETIKKYDNSVPKGTTKVVVEGKDGYVFKNNDGNTILTQKPITEEIIIGTGPLGSYTGIITGYGPDCSTCSGKGYVACRTEDKKNFNLITDGIYYNDDEYGKVRVMAAALSKFPCGTIVEVKSSNLGDFIGIVLDTGYDMRKHYDEGIYHFDIAYKTEKDEMVSKTTNKSGNVVFNVQRWGW